MAKQELCEHIATIDLETLGIASNSVIISAGVTVSRYEDKDITFQELISNGLERKFDIKEQITLKRAVNDKVVKWWYEQSPEARKILIPSPTDVSLYTFYDDLVKFFKDKEIDIKKVDFYDRRSFDLSKLEYLFVEEQKVDVPWDFHKEYEVSTALKYMGFDRYGGIFVKDIEGAVYHNALHDAAIDHLRILKCLHSSI